MRDAHSGQHESKAVRIHINNINDINCKVELQTSIHLITKHTISLYNNILVPKITPYTVIITHPTHLCNATQLCNSMHLHVVSFMNIEVHLTPDPHHMIRVHQITTITICNVSPTPTWNWLLAPDLHHRTKAHQNLLPSL